MRRAVGGLCVLALVSACGSSGSRPPSASTSTPSSGCADAQSAGFSWPANVPGDFPKPAMATLEDARTLAPTTAGAGRSGVRKGGVVVSLRVANSLRSQIIFVQTYLPKAGFTLGRGDAEEDEADIPFRRSDVTGQLRLHRAAPCSTTWVLTVLPR